MRPMRPMRLMRLIGLIGLMSACSSDSDIDLEPVVPSQGKIIPQVACLVTPYEEDGTTKGNWANEANWTNEANEANGATKTTKAWSIPSGYSAYDNGKKSIGIAFTRDGYVPDMGTFFYVNEKWRTSVEDIEDATYYLYGYIPHLPAIRYSITDLNPIIDDDSNGETVAEHDGYSRGAVMTLENIPSVMSNDLCVVIGAKDGTGKETVEGLRRGDFSFKAVPTSNEEPRNFVFLLFDHLYAALRVRIKVDGDYDALRTIKLKSLELSTLAEEEVSRDHTDITINLAATDGSSSPIQDITYVERGEKIGSGDKEGIEFWASETAEGETLTTSFKPFTGYFMPKDITTFAVTSVYDVYDKKGNLLHKDCKATNTIRLADIIPYFPGVKRGWKYGINMTVVPTYLYVLSDPDLDNPTMVVN